MQFGKWTAEGAVKGESRVFCDAMHALEAQGMEVPGKAHGNVKQGGTADKRLFVLEGIFVILLGAFCFLKAKGEKYGYFIISMAGAN